MYSYKDIIVRFLTPIIPMIFVMISIRIIFRGLYRLCECGCGTLIPIINKLGRISRFKNGHGNKGIRNGQYKSGRYMHNGYWILTMRYDHPNSNKRGRIPEHVYNFTVRNGELFCCMLPWGVIHHKDENRQNNEISNLEGMVRSNHLSHHKIWLTRTCETWDQIRITKNRKYSHILIQ